MRLLKDVIAVKPLHKPLHSTVIAMPENMDSRYILPIKALVMAVGSKFRYKDIIGIGHTVLVPNHLGNRHVINGEELFFYEAEENTLLFGISIQLCAATLA